jgi:hypothetical protein
MNRSDEEFWPLLQLVAGLGAEAALLRALADILGAGAKAAAAAFAGLGAPASSAGTPVLRPGTPVGGRVYLRKHTCPITRPRDSAEVLLHRGTLELG